MRQSRPRPALMILFVFLLGAFVARLPATIGQLIGIKGDFLGPITDVQQFLAESYVTEPDMDKLQRGAIDGMLEALDDPYAQYIPPADRAEFEKEMLGRFCGIGALVQLEDGLPTIVTPLDDSPAYRAGILAGDRIIEVDSKPTIGLPLDDIIAQLTGEPGTPVSLKIRRAEQTLDLTLKRQEITVRAVRGVTRGPDSSWNYFLDTQKRFGYIRLSQFIPTAPEELAKALESLGAPDGTLAGLVLDLRDNPGGDLDACLEIADMFISEGTIVAVQGRAQPSEVYEAAARGTLPDFPMVVLINESSASASEILAGALADHGRATIVGARTYGKGLVQTVRPLPHLPGAHVKYTIQRYTLPSGRVIQRSDDSMTWGVDPTPGFYVPMPDADQFASQLKRREFDVLRPATNGNAEAPSGQRWGDPAWIESELKDVQLAAGVRALDTRIASGSWTPLGDAQAQSHRQNLAELRRLTKSQQLLVRAMTQVQRRMQTVAFHVPEEDQKEPDLWPDALDLTNGNVRVFDPQGKMVADLRITGRDIERWLLMADIEPSPPTVPPAPTPEPK